MIRLLIDSPAQQEKLGERLASLLTGDCLLFLSGDLGTGKTTLARGILRGLGHSGVVKSPSYTLVEPYELAGRTVYHLDLYRVTDPHELDEFGLRDLVGDGSLMIVEWPERGATALPTPDIEIRLSHAGHARVLELSAGTRHGTEILAHARPWLTSSRSA
jgi:tRNA threonylcarbamoyladenosine biosynthesis protein TsaE